MNFLLSKSVACSLLVLLCLAFPLVAATSATDSEQTDKHYSLQVNVTTQIKSDYQQALQYVNDQRVNQVIADATAWAKKHNYAIYQHNSDNIYWPAAGLFEQNNAELQKQLTAVLKKLDANKKTNAPRFNQAISHFKRFLMASIFKKRVNTPIELDYHQANGKINPMLTGFYQLYLPAKSLHVWLVGAVEKPLILPFQTQASANDYLDKASRLNNFGQSYIWLISPNGTVQKQGIAHWNKEDSFIQPGSVIYLPFKDFPEQLNSEIVALLQHRVMSL